MARARRELPLLSVALRHEADVVLARQRARLLAELLGSSSVDQTRLATAVSEVARNAVKHGDLDASLYHPSRRLDVHMGEHDFVCTDCHRTEHHDIRGRADAYRS